MQLRGKKALVTGGSRGIGRAIARVLAQEGADVAICGRTRQTLEEAARDISAETDRRVLPIVADMRRAEDITRFVAESAAELGGIDILVNNAVESTIEPILDSADAEILQHFTVKFLGYLRCIRAALPHLEARGGGRIVNIGGIAMRLGHIGSSSSGPPNAALTNLTKNLATALAPRGITVNIVHPGGVYTERTAGGIRRNAAERGVSVDEILRERGARVPIGRMVQPEDIAHLTVCLCAAQAGAITGQSIAVDGGSVANVYY
jgi:NAD(P)-dependent dehydrogenase (short-subunit alcohol dehydrogenase family)